MTNGTEKHEKITETWTRGCSCGGGRGGDVEGGG